MGERQNKNKNEIKTKERGREGEVLCVMMRRKKNIKYKITMKIKMQKH